MKFSTSKTELQKALQKLAKAVPNRSTLPVLGCVLIDALENKTTLKTTDLEITIQTEVPSSLEEKGSCALPLKTLFEITNELPDTRLTIKVDEKNRAVLTTDLGEYDLMARPSDEFPATPEQINPKTISIPGKVLKELIDATSFAVSRDELKPALTGVFLKISTDRITAVSTDGHKLVQHTRIDHDVEELEKDVIIPKKFLSYLSSQLKDEKTDLILSENNLSVVVGSDVVITRIIDETFPNYKSVIPENNDKKLKVDKKQLLGAIRRVSIFSNKSTHQVALSLSSAECKITTEDPEKSSKAQEVIGAEYKGDQVVIGYNAEYLKEIVAHVKGEEVVIELSTPVSAALFNSSTTEKKTENIMLLMPIRLND